MPAAALGHDAQAMAIGERLFVNNCATCHGSDARGSKGFPEPDRRRLAVGRHAGANRRDHRGRPQRHDAADGRGGRQRRRRAQRRALRAQPVGQPAQLDCRAARARRSSPPAPPAMARDGKGNPALGAPNLADGIWLHGWGEAKIVAMVTQRQDQRDAGARGAADARPDPAAVAPLSGACRSRDGAIGRSREIDQVETAVADVAALVIALREAAKIQPRVGAAAGSPAGAGRSSGSRSPCSTACRG